MLFKRALVFLFIFCTLFVSGQNEEVDSLKKVIGSKLHDTLKLQALSDLNWIYTEKDAKLAKQYGLDELKLATKISDKKWIAQAYNDIGISFYKLGSLDSALSYYNRSLAIRNTLKDKKLIASSLSKIGLIQHEMADYADALNNQFKVLAIYEELGNENYIAMTLNNISQTYDKLKSYDKEIEYGEKALAIHLKNGNEYLTAQCYGNLGSAYKMKNNIAKSNDYLQKALVIFKKFGDRSNEAGILNSIGLNLRLDSQDKEALEYYKKAYNIAVEIEDHSGVMLYSHNISAVLTDLGNYTEAEKYSLAALKAIEPKNKAQLLLTYRQLATIYGYLKDGKKTDLYLNKYTNLKDTLFTQESAGQIAEMEIKYHSEKKDLELAKNKAEIEAKERQNTIKNLIILSILVIALLGSLLVYSAQKRKRLKHQAEMDAEFARQKELRSKAVIEAEEKERRRIAQDLHDGVGQILSAAKLNLSGLESKLKLDDAEQASLLANALDLVNDSVKEVRAVSHNMMPNTLIKLGLASAVREFITKIGTVPNLKIDLQIIGLDERLENTIETVLYRVIQEIVSNIIKHAKANQISMQLIKHEGELTIMIEDNGVGFDKKNLDKFEGIGLKNIISRVEFLNGRVEFDSTPGQGTTVVVEVPLS